MSEDEKVAMETLASVATALWRIKIKMDAGSPVELPHALRHLPRHVQAAWDALAAGHIQVNDLIGAPYVPGMCVNILTFQPVEGAGAQSIHETLKPEVRFKHRLIQHAEVIVARPLREAEIDNAGTLSASDDAASEADTSAEKENEPHGPNHD